MQRLGLAAPLVSLCLALVVSGCEAMMEPGHEEWAPPVGAAKARPLTPREPCAHRDGRRQAFFGDLHVHTAYSMDAQAWGLTLTPDDAYLYATGETVVLPPRASGKLRRLRIDRPLDFAAVTDHAEWMAEVALCTTPGSPVYAAPSCRIYRGEETWWVTNLLGLEGFASRVAGIAGFSRRPREICGEDAGRCRDQLGALWQATQAAAERFYDRSAACAFTTFHAWEHSYTPGNSKVHRNVILRNEIVPELPLSWIDTPDPESLRQKLRELCTDNGSGCDAIAIPHNPNLANGRMFAVADRRLPLETQRERSRLRARLEPIVEMMQIKGESECRNGLAGVVGGPDELCDFEKKRDMPGQIFEDCGEGTGSGGQSMLGCISRLDQARFVLIEGLREKERIGVNPYKLGFIGSTDTHTAAPGGVAEWSEGVPLGRVGLDARQRLTIGQVGEGSVVWNSPGGLAGVWAEENSRGSLFDAMRRREVFATSGPRIKPRLFAGWELPGDLCQGPDFVRRADAAGVPMGADLPPRPDGAGAPGLAVWALADPGGDGHPGGLLERIQIIKGWVDPAGRFHQRIVDVAGVPEAGADVDLDTCAPRGPGAVQLCAVWRDPDFDPARAAVYYARVLENPSCRWTTWQCLRLAEDERPDGCTDPRVPSTIQERAWTSAVWYSP
jgi:hypothetical protein